MALYRARNAEAESDANSAISIDGKYAKGYYRLGLLHKVIHCIADLKIVRHANTSASFFFFFLYVAHIYVLSIEIFSFYFLLLL